jgi:hypothetical protein
MSLSFTKNVDIWALSETDSLWYINQTTSARLGKMVELKQCGALF